MDKRTCPVCESGFAPRSGAGGSQQIYCTAKCRVTAQRKRAAVGRNEREAAKRADLRRQIRKVCIHCGETFTPKKSLGKQLCSDECRSARGRDSLSRTCSMPECDLPHRAKGLCNKHYRAILRAEGRIKPQPWDDKKRDAYQRRKAVKRGASTGRPVLRDEIAERDGFTCGLCSEPVDMAVQWPDPLSPTLDHIVPLALGGPHDPDNVQLAHLTCNSIKGPRMSLAS